MYKRLKKLCKKRGLSINKLEEELEIAKGSLCKMTTSKPSVRRAQKIANYFGVTVDYLMTGRENKTELNARDEKDFAKVFATMRGKLLNKEDGPASFDGENVSEESAELLLTQIEAMLRTIKVINKEKYNPNKNEK